MDSNKKRVKKVENDTCKYNMDAEQRSKVATRVTLVGMIWNILLTIGKIIFGYLGKSMALVADGMHSASDLLSDLFILIAFQFSKKPADDDHNYGHGKIDVISEAVVSILLFVVAYEMIFKGVSTIAMMSKNPLVEPGYLVIIMAVASIVVKEWMYHYTMIYGRKIDSGVLKANAIHHRTDSFSSIAVVIALVVAKIFGGMWLILDPVIAILVALYIAKIGLDILKKSYYNLIDGAITEDEFNMLMDILNNDKDISDPHNIRTRRIGNSIAIELHVRVDANMRVLDAHDVATNIENKIKQEFGQDTFVSIHVEPIKVNGEYK